MFKHSPSLYVINLLRNIGKLVRHTHDRDKRKGKISYIIYNAIFRLEEVLLCNHFPKGGERDDWGEGGLHYRHTAILGLKSLSSFI